MSPGARLAAVSTGVFGLDQASKWLVVEAMGLAERMRIDVAPGFLTFRMGWNRGINFGLFASGSETARLALAALAVAAGAGVAVWALRRGDPRFAVGAALVVGGALGNAVDRLRYGAVADFLNVTCCGIVNPYAFNIADVAIFAGAFAIALAPAQAPRRSGGDAK